jgi:hypothetical protein
MFSHVGWRDNLLVNIPDPAINYHDMLSMVLGLVGHCTKNVVVLLQEMKHTMMKRNKPL